MGSSKSQTIGYKYFMGVHCGISLPVDAVLEFKAGGRVAWQGEVNASSTIEVNAPDLFGGDEREGGLVGTLDLMFGEPTQGTNAYLEAQQGLPQPAYRGFLSAVYRGQIAALNPYIKPWSWRVRSIKAGWNGGACWYEAKAAVNVVAGYSLASNASDWEYQVIDHHASPGYSNLEIPTSGWSVGQAPFAGGTLIGSGNTDWPIRTILWARRSVEVPAPTSRLKVVAENGCVVFVNGISAAEVNRVNESIANNHVNEHLFDVAVGSAFEIAVKAFDEVEDPAGGGTFLSVEMYTDDYQAMNPAHIVYQCLTDPDWGMGYPAATIDDTDFRAAADALFAEGFGLCLKWSNQTEIGEFCQIVADHAGFNIAQDRKTGLFRLVLLRDDYDIETLPTFDKSQVKVIKAQRPSLEGTINEVIVKFRDTVTQKEATTAPLQNLANIQAQGRVISQTLRFDGIPTHDLAVRVGMRELRARSTPLWRMSLEFQRGAASALVPGEPFVVDLLDTELAVKLVMRAGEMDYGSPTAGTIAADCVEDVFGLPASTYLVEQSSGWQPPNTTPQPATATAFEVPYRELVQSLSAADLAALPADAGYVAAAAVRPSGAPLNFALRTRIGTNEFEQVGIGDFAPSCLLTAECPIEHGPTILSVDAGVDLGDLVVGTAAWLGDGASAEMVRIDAIDAGAGTITVGRACGDTVPKAWPVGTRLWGYDNDLAADNTQYIDGESVDAKVLPRTSAGELAESSAPAMPVLLDARQARPYPPAGLLINSTEYPTTASGVIDASWVHRDRILQADQLLDTAEAGVGPESGTTYTFRVYLDGVQDYEGTGITGTFASHAPAVSGEAEVQLEAWRDGLRSWQVHSHTFEYTAGSNDPYWANVTALLHFDGSNGSTTITDVKGNTWTAAGSAALSTTSPIAGTASLYIPNTSGYVENAMAGGAWEGIGTGDYTIEWYQKIASSGATDVLFDCRPGGTNGAYPQVYKNSGNKLVFFLNSAERIVGSTNITSAVAQHVAVSRVSGVTYLFLDGVLEGSYADTNSYPDSSFRIARSQIGGSAAYPDGYFDEWRITVGVGRYSSAFVPPSIPFPNS